MATEDKLRDYLRRVTVDLTETRHRLAETEQQQHEPIAIIGMSCRFPGGGDTVEGYWDLLREGRSGVVEVPASRWNIDEYYNPDRRAVGGVYTRHGAFLPDVAGWDAEFFGASPQEALRMDPQQRLLMELVWEGLEDAGTSPARLAGSRTGVMVGFMDTVQYGRLETERYGPGIAADPYFGQGVSASVVAGRLAYHFDLRGPAVTLDTACSSSLVGLHLAAQALRRGECDLAVAAGVFLIMQPDTYVQACATSMLSGDGRCKTFDSSADGYVMGEGGGLVVLERLSSALRNGRRIRAVLRGSAMNQDGRSNGLTAPSRSAQVDVIRRALADAGVGPDELDYVEAHGSGTRLGDAIELSALHDVFGARPAGRPLHVGAVKTNIGHTQSAAGVAGLIKTVLVLEHGTVPPNLNLTEPSGAVPEDGTVRPVTASLPFPERDGKRLAGVSSFGWSGTNTHLVLESTPPPSPVEPVEPVNPAEPVGDAVALAVSAVSPVALGAQQERLAQWLDGRSDINLADVAHTLTVGRTVHDYRRALVCADRADAARRLADAAATAAEAARAKGRPRVAFLLPGVGDQYVGLGRELYRTEPVYAETVDRCVALARERGGVDLRPMFAAVPDELAPAAGAFAALVGRAEPDADTDPLFRAEIAHPFLFTVEYALAKLLARWGVAPDLLVGYSVGEYVAACLSGVFDLGDALHVVVERARLIAQVPAGRMVAVAADEDTVRAAIAANGLDVEVAAVNGPVMTVLSGVSVEIDAAAGELTARGIACRPLRTAHAFHSSLLGPVRDKLAALVASVPREAPRTAIVANATGTTLTAEQATSPDYWADHLVNPVRFAESVGHCVAQDVDVYVELGAGQMLGGLVRQNLTGVSTAIVLGTLPARWTAGKRPDSRTELLETCARLWEAGVGVDWTATRPAQGRIVTLPTYPFQRTRFWPEPGDAAPAAPAAPATASRSADPVDLCYAPAWRRDVARAAPTPLRLPGPLVIFSDAADDTAAAAAPHTAGGIGAALADLAAAGGTPVVEVLAGTGLRRDGRRIVIDPAERKHYREVFATVDTPGPVHVVHLWSLNATAARPGYASEAELRDALRYGFDSLLLAVQGFGDLPARTGIRLLTVSRGGTEVVGADVPAPYRSVVHGLGRVVQHEYPGVTWQGVDLDPDPAAGPHAAGQLAYELTAEPGDAHPAVAGWRRGRRWIPEWAAVSTVDDEAAASPWRSDGVYLITGGTRGLGMALARHLVRAGVRRLALVSRTPLDRGPGGHGDSADSSAVADADARLLRSRADVAALEAAGAEVLLLTADAGRPGELRNAVRRCRERFGAVHGVVHAAGLPAGGMVQRRTIGEAAAVLAPKVLAMAALAELVGPDTPADLRPELLVLYSSAVTAFGGIGEGDYCAANTVLDAYGAALAGTAPSTRVLTVAWGPWLHDDWQADGLAGTGGGLAERARAYRQRYGFADDAGCAYLDRLIGTGQSSVVAVRQPMLDALREWSAMLDLDALVGAGSAVPTGARFPRPQLRTAYVAPRTGLEASIAAVWQAYLGIDRVGVHDPFFDLGGNSLVGMAMVRAVETDLNASIAPAVLFEHPTVAEFAAAVAGAGNGEGATAQELLTTSSARGERRRRARPGTRTPTRQTTPVSGIED
jgi:acyl transferase domain-containing protein